MAERKKAIELIGARQVAEREALAPDLRGARREGRERRPRRRGARAGRGRRRRRQDPSMAMRVRAEIEAEAMRMMNEAHNMLTPEARMSALRMKLVEKAEAIIRESVRPMERIEGIKILHVDGLGGGRATAQRRRRPRRQLLRRPRQLGAALPRAGAARRPAAARDRHRGRRHPAPGRRRQRRAGRAAARAASNEGMSAMIRVYVSSVIDASADTVWSRDPRLQRHAAVASRHRRQPDRERRGERPGRLHPPLPHPRRRHDPRAPARALRLRLLVRLRDPREPDGRRELRRHAQAHAGDRRRALLRRVERRVRLRRGARARARRDDRRPRLPGRLRRPEARTSRRR